MNAPGRFRRSWDSSGVRCGGRICCGVVVLVVVLAAPRATAQTTHYNRIPLHQPENDLRIGAGLEIGSGVITRGGSMWAGLEGAITTRIRPWLSVGGELAWVGNSIRDNLLYPSLAADDIVRGAALIVVHSARALGMELSAGMSGGPAIELAKIDVSPTATAHEVRFGVAGGPIAGLHFFPLGFLSIDADVGALFVGIPSSHFGEWNAVSVFARLGLAVHLD